MLLVNLLKIIFSSFLNILIYEQQIKTLGIQRKDEFEIILHVKCVPSRVYLNFCEILILNITKNTGLGWNKLDD